MNVNPSPAPYRADPKITSLGDKIGDPVRPANFPKAILRYRNDRWAATVGPQTAARYAALLSGAGTIVWNGPVGVFEFAAFENGTRALAEAIAASKAFSIAGGGDTLAAIAKFGVTDRIGYISTGGGAFLEFLEGRKLPAIEILESRASGGKA